MIYILSASHGRPPMKLQLTDTLPGIGLIRQLKNLVEVELVYLVDHGSHFTAGQLFGRSFYFPLQCLY